MAFNFPPKKTKPASDLSAPAPLEVKKKAPKPPAPEPTALDIEHEQGESTMDFGSLGAKYGLSEDESKAFAYDVLEACMKATGGASHEAEEPPEAEGNESDAEDYPA